MVGHGGSSAGSYLADPTSPIPSHCVSIVATSTIRVNHSENIHLAIFTLHTMESDILIHMPVTLGVTLSQIHSPQNIYNSDQNTVCL